jgi:PTH1 family peptidyl-tRNA hydrolase
MDKFDWLIIGLGNPGDKYAKTRHNIGWMTAQAFCEDCKAQIKEGSNIYYYAELSYARNNIFVCFPTTYMNNSGEAAKKIASKYGIPTNRIIALVDEYNFPLGKVHLKTSGSDGGHNGIGSLIDELNATNFARLRLGIDRNFGMGELVEYVLSEFKPEEQEALKTTIEMGVDSLKHIIKSGIQRAMSDINSGAIWERKKAKEEAKNKTDENKA